MTTNELKKYIDRVLGNSVRCLLPSYWWKRLFGLTVDAIADVEKKIKNVKVDAAMDDSSTNPVQNRTIKNYVDGKANIPVVEVTYTIGSPHMYPNTYYRITVERDSLTISLATPEDNTVLNNYMVEFITSSTSDFTLSAPASIKWANGQAPVFDRGKIYQISIINNLAVITSF